MKKLISILFVLVALCGCQSSDKFKELPEPIMKFVSQYWPNPAIASYTQPTATTYEVVIKNSASLWFDSDYSWTKIDGNGLPLPEVLLYNVLPEKVYQYLDSGSLTGEVFVIERTPREYNLTLLNTYVTYDIGSRTLTQH